MGFRSSFLKSFLVVSIFLSFQLSFFKALGGGEDSGVGYLIFLRQASFKFGELLQEEAPLGEVKRTFDYDGDYIRLPGLKSRYSGLRDLCIEGDFLRTIRKVNECHEYRLTFEDKRGRKSEELLQTLSEVMARSQELREEGFSNFSDQCTEDGKILDYVYYPIEEVGSTFKMKFFAKPNLSDVVRNKVETKSKELQVGDAKLPFMNCQEIRANGKDDRAIWKTADELKIISL